MVKQLLLFAKSIVSKTDEYMKQNKLTIKEGKAERIVLKSQT